MTTTKPAALSKGFWGIYLVLGGQLPIFCGGRFELSQRYSFPNWGGICCFGRRSFISSLNYEGTLRTCWWIKNCWSCFGNSSSTARKTKGKRCCPQDLRGCVLAPKKPSPLRGLKIWMFPKIGVPQNGWSTMENRWFGGTSIFGNTDIVVGVFRI